MGSGPFEAGPVAASLMLRPDNKEPCTHGVVEPDNRMALAEYQGALAATRDSWECAE